MVSDPDVVFPTLTTSRSDFLAWGQWGSPVFFCPTLPYWIFALKILIRGYLWIGLVVQWGQADVFRAHVAFTALQGGEWSQPRTSVFGYNCGKWLEGRKAMPGKSQWSRKGFPRKGCSHGALQGYCCQPGRKRSPRREESCGRAWPIGRAQERRGPPARGSRSTGPGSTWGCAPLP